MYYLNPANSLSEAMGGGKERVAPGCLSPGASLRVVGVFYRRMGYMRFGLGVALVCFVSSWAYCAGPIEDKTPRAEAIKANFDKLVSEDKEVKREALLYFGKVDKTFAAEVPLFTASLKDERNPVRAISAFALGKIGEAAAGAIPAVEKLLTDSSATVQKYAKRALERLKPFKLDPKKPAHEKATEAQGTARKWTSRNGKNSAVAKLLEVDRDGSVILQRADGKTLRLPFSKLSQADLEYLKSTNEYKNYLKHRRKEWVKILRERIKMSTEVLDLSQGWVPMEQVRRGETTTFRSSVFSGRELADADLAHLEGLTKLQDLSLNNTEITDAGLAHLKGLTKLKKLNLGSCRGITDDGLVHLKGMTGLEDLNLSGTNSGLDGGLAHLKGLTKLKELWLSTAKKVTDVGLAHLKGLTNIETLALEATKTTDAGLVHLKGLTRLQYLYLSGTKVTDAGLVHLKGLTELKELKLEYIKVTDAGVKKLQQALPNCDISR
jgi:hypothetical protein